MSDAALFDFFWNICEKILYGLLKDFPPRGNSGVKILYIRSETFIYLLPI